MNKCLRPDCTGESITRGLCSPCYQAARRLIRDGLTSWQQLEQAGKSLPHNRRNPGPRASWMLDTKPTR